MFENEFTVQEIGLPSRIIQTVAGKNKVYFLDYHGKVYTATVSKNEENGREFIKLSIDKKPIPIECLIKTISFAIEAGYLLGVDSSLRFLYDNVASRNIDEKIINKKIFQISCGPNFVIAIMEDHSVWVRGDNLYGQLGLGNFEIQPFFTPVKSDEKFVSVFCGRDYSIFLSVSQTVYSCGFNYGGQLGFPAEGEHPNLQLIEKLRSISSISSTNGSTHCIDMDGNLFAFGLNQFGSLGVGDTKPRLEPEKVNGIPPISHISNGIGEQTIIYDKNGDIWITGIHISCKSRSKGRLLTKFIKVNQRFNQSFITQEEEFNSWFEEVDKTIRKNYVSHYIYTKNAINFYLIRMMNN